MTSYLRKNPGTAYCALLATFEIDFDLEWQFSHLQADQKQPDRLFQVDYFQHWDTRFLYSVWSSPVFDPIDCTWRSAFSILLKRPNFRVMKWANYVKCRIVLNEYIA